MMEMTNSTEIGWNFDNSYAQLPNTLFTSLDLNPVPDPKLVLLNEPLAKSLGLNVQALKRKEGVDELAGCHVPDEGFPLAQAYAGHQFGHFTRLGDGRAILLGEQLTPAGERFDIQLKGAGRTPYSRGGDGRAALGPMLREYIISEAMHALGTPTTRSLAVVETGESVYRETELRGAIVTRVAASHLRVGTFQYVAQWGSKEDLMVLADYAINRHYPYLKDVENRYLAFLAEVIKRQAALIAKWQLVGFIHGVMNTDNMTISGETIDYGPCAFMDTYDRGTVFSSIDLQGRYAYGNQPPIAAWNLTRFAESLLPLLHDNSEEAVNLAQQEIEKFSERFNVEWLAGMRRKLGLLNEETQDKELIDELLKMMEKREADFTNTFRALTLNQPQETDLYEQEEFEQWMEKWTKRREQQSVSVEESQKIMQESNAAVIPRNHRVEEAIEAAVENEDYQVMEKLLAVLADPYAYSSEQLEYANPPAPSDCIYQTFCGT